MEADLLLKEDEFYKENEKLEMRTKQLMLKAQDALKTQEYIIQDCFKPVEEERSSSGKINVDEVKTESVHGKIYQAKLKVLVVEKEKALQELRLKCEEVKKLQKENHTLKEEKDKWFLMYNTTKNSIGKLESQLINLNSRLQAKDTENISLKKEGEQLRKELKTLTQNLNNLELRLTRASEEGDKYKAALKQTREGEKDVKDSCRKQIAELTSALKQAEKQKLELLAGFKKQMQLIDVLKKQKVHLESIKVGEMLESEYLKILDWKFG